MYQGFNFSTSNTCYFLSVSSVWLLGWYDIRRYEVKYAVKRTGLQDLERELGFYISLCFGYLAATPGENISPFSGQILLDIPGSRLGKR